MPLPLLLRSPVALGLTLGGTTATILPSLLPLLRPSSSSSSSSLLYCDAPATRPTTSTSTSRRNESKIYRQISGGSVIGLLAGLAVGTFSRTLTFLFGVLVLGVQYAASKGIHIVPYQRIQRYLKGVNVRSALEDNIAFKVAFGTTFALAAFAPL
ncbi:MAG: hypothetical protein M1816_003239 [Peltula sp. TS41687]|nr:MAG: hypothetical protein M1816_003239 [Peltula sp. TS41687]